jgi:hypothetical protein
MSSSLQSAIKQFRYYKSLGDAVLVRLSEEQLNWQANAASNSVATIVRHLHSNMLSRWTDFLATDGEKPWRNRDTEFSETALDQAAVHKAWEEGWQCLLDTLALLQEADLEQIVYIRNEGHTVQEAINRQLCHYPYHVGQLVYIGKLLLGDGWESLSIPRGGSSAYNQARFEKEKQVRHFTDGL